jgi:hypothetical protein
MCFTPTRLGEQSLGIEAHGTIISSGGPTSPPPSGSQREHRLSTSVKPSVLARAILFLATCDNPQRIVGQRTLQYSRAVGVSANSHKSTSSGVVRMDAAAAILWAGG